MRRFLFFIRSLCLCGSHPLGQCRSFQPLAPVVTDNAGDHNHEGNTARPVRPYLMAGNGSFMTRVEYWDWITVELYNEMFLSQQDLR